MAGEGFRVPFLQFWTNWVMIVASRCHTLLFGALADSQEQVENRPHCITRGSSDGGTASPSDATSTGEGKWEEITTALTAKSSDPRELQISNNIDTAGEFKVLLAPAALASQPTDGAATGPSVQCQTPSARGAVEDSKEQSVIITEQRTPKPAVQDVKIGNEILVVNTSFTNIESDQIESLNQDQVRIRVDALYEDRFRKLGNLELDNATGGLAVEDKPLEGPAHVPPSVSEGLVSTFAMHVDKTKTTLVPTLLKRGTAEGEGAEVLGNLERTSPTQKSLPLDNDGSGSLGQGTSSSSSM